MPRHRSLSLTPRVLAKLFGITNSSVYAYRKRLKGEMAVNADRNFTPVSTDGVALRYGPGLAVRKNALSQL